MTVSAYPAATTTLMGIFTAAFPVGSGVSVFRGGGSSDTAGPKFIHVGLQALDQASFPGNSGEGAMQWATMGTGHSRDERFGVNCVARVWYGNDDPAARETETFALFGAAIDAIKTDPSIGRPGGVLYLDTYTWTYADLFDSDGTSGVINFTLNFRARI